MNIEEFITARLDEEQAAAEAATAGPWEWTPESPPERGSTGGGPALVTVAHSATEEDTPAHWVAEAQGYEVWGIEVGAADAAHIVAYAPNRISREIQAKRTLLDLHESCYAECGEQEPIHGSLVRATWPCPTIRTLAAIWADHPDYQEGWAP